MVDSDYAESATLAIESQSLYEHNPRHQCNCHCRHFNGVINAALQIRRFACCWRKTLPSGRSENQWNSTQMLKKQ